MARKISLAKQFSWRLEYLGYLVMETLLRFIPLAVIDRLGSTIGFLFFYLSPYYRKLAIRNLRIALGAELSLSEIHRLARATCQRTIANFLGTLKTTILPSNEVDAHVEFLERDLLTQALQKGKGAILVLGHMGNWEILNRLHQFLPPGTPAGGIYQPLKNPLVNALLLKRREQDGSRLFNKRDGFHAPASFVKEGGLLIVVADQKVGKAGTAIPFFNRLSTLSPLPALLARKAGSPVLAAGIETIAPGKWRVVFRPIGESPETTTIISSLEELIRRSPADYLWLHNRWRPKSRTPLAINNRKGKGKVKTLPTTAMRILLLTCENPVPQDLTNYLLKRNEGDIPLAFEYLTIRDQAQKFVPSPFPIRQAIAPSPEQLAAQIKTIDLEQPVPIELALILTPSSLLESAVKLAKLPHLRINHEESDLKSFLDSLTVNPPQS